MRLLALVLLLAAPVGLAACSDDDYNQGDGGGSVIDLSAAVTDLAGADLATPADLTAHD